MRTKINIICLVLLGGLASCRYTRYVPAGKSLLWEQSIKLEGGTVNYQAESILKQEPNLSLAGWRVGLGLYNWGDGTDSSFFGRLGRAPVIFDSSLAEQSSQQLQNYYFNKGYFQVSGQYLTRRKKQKTKVVYRLKLGPRYRIDSISHDIATPELASLTQYFSRGSEIKHGMAYDAEKLEAERRRLRDIFRNHGYYNFSPQFISYRADTVSPAKPHALHLAMVIANRRIRDADSLRTRPHRKHRISEVVIQPDYNFLQQKQRSDTLRFQDYLITYQPPPAYQSRYLTDAIHFAPGDLYRFEAIKNTYDHLAGYNAFNVTEILFRELDTLETDTPRLRGLVRLSPRKKYTWNVETEVTNTSNNYGVSGSIGIVDRNVFKAGEALRFDIISGLEYQPTVGNVNNLSRTFELGAELSLNFPRFILPFNTVGLLPKRMQPQSTVSLFANRTNRIEFDRETFGAQLGYRWRENELKRHRIQLLSLSYSNLFSIQSRFLEQLNPVQQLAFNPEFISSTAYGFVYSGQSLPLRRDYHFFKGDLEVGGTVQSAFAEAPVEDDVYYRIGGVPVYQFARLETDYRYYWRISEERTWIQRLLLGYVIPYGISNIESTSGKLRLPPFSRFFFLGGSNDLRAWPAYRAGGGSSQVTSYRGTPSDSNGFAVGTFKALLSSEYRFPIFGSIKGALFVDAGNIWFTGGLEREQVETGLELNSLLSDLYVGSGFGLRIDLDFFVIRFDAGLKVRDPGYRDQGEEWVIATKPVFPNLTYNIALGYPF